MQKSEFQLVKQQLLSIDYKLNPEYQLNENVNMKINANVKVHKNSKNNASVILELIIFDEEKFQSNPFYIKAKIQGYFNWENHLEDELVDKLLHSNAPAVLLSYLRSLISQLTLSSGIPALVLPLLNFTK